MRPLLGRVREIVVQNDSTEQERATEKTGDVENIIATEEFLYEISKRSTNRIV